MARNNLSFHAVKCLPEIFSVGSNIQQGSVSGLERDAHNDLKRLPTPQKHEDIVARSYVAATPYGGFLAYHVIKM